MHLREEVRRSGRWETRAEARLGGIHSGALSTVPKQKLYTESMLLCAVLCMQPALQGGHVYWGE